MAEPQYELHRSPTDAALLDDVRKTSDRIGLAGLLGRRGHRARRTRVPGSAVVEGFRWRLFDEVWQRWWPQGISVGQYDGVPLVLVSWFAQPKRGIEMGSRISVVDLRNRRRPRYHHVLLVSSKREGDSIGFDPVVVHAGGIAWTGDRLLVSATFGGIREFRLSDILRAPSRGPLRRGTGPFGYRYLLPEFATHQPPAAKHRDRMRYSFVGLETASDARQLDSDAELRLVTGEFGPAEDLRLARLGLTDDRSILEDLHIPGISSMQGVVVHDGTWYVNASENDKLGGDLWVGTPGNMTRHANVLPPGPEDLAVWPERSQLWSLTEFPTKRWVFCVDLGALAD